jgi:hypothetical protein
LFDEKKLNKKSPFNNFFLKEKIIGLKGSRVTNEGGAGEKREGDGEWEEEEDQQGEHMELFAAFYTTANLKGQ